LGPKTQSCLGKKERGVRSDRESKQKEEPSPESSERVVEREKKLEILQRGKTGVLCMNGAAEVKVLRQRRSGKGSIHVTAHEQRKKKVAELQEGPVKIPTWPEVGEIVGRPKPPEWGEVPAD